MSKTPQAAETLFELTPLENVEYLPAGEYIVVNKNNFPFLTPYTDADGWWQLDKPSRFTHYLRPLPALTAEERKFTRIDIESAYIAGWASTSKEPLSVQLKEYMEGM